MQAPERRHVHTVQIHVRWGDMDAMGHVNNSRYFTYLEQARVEWLRVLDLPWNEQAGPILASTRCDFKQPVHYPATLRVDVFVGLPGRSSLPTYYEVRREDQPDLLCATGEAVLVWFDFEKERSAPLPDTFRQALTNGD